MTGAGNYGGYNHNARSPPRYGRSSRSPPRYRDERDRDYYDRRPRSPPRRGYRSPSPRGGPQFPLPRRHGRDVPEVQILVLDEADRNFVKFVDAAFAAQFRTHTLSLSPRLPVDEVIRQMVVEGVDAVVILNRNLQYRNKISLQCFDRRGGANVKFEEYADVDINVGVALVQRLKQAAAAVAAPPAMGYGMPPPVGYPPIAAPPVAAAPGANLANIISSLDPAALQNVIGALAKAQQPGAAPVAPGYPPAGLPAGFAMPGYPGAGAPGPGPATQGAPTQQVQDIMAQLARLQGRQ
ncbi:hypothetical protein SAICODRAFT_28666 [Saitoella complicata NRRL Y-17804]|nr:uncharacterized protein SAICODRAFT_28666 [Saitoella complicata NRRL Y-17804]ODQ56588.1 hypothetical protein SAICODRAFT_28666 [Saitoella complicata NRRL Y-17804]